MAAVHKGMIAMGTELAFAAGWLAGTPFGMPSESAPVYNMADADEATGHVRGEGYWDFLTSLSEVREYYANSYFAGFVISRKRIPQFAPPKVVSRTDPKSKTDPRKNTDPRKKTDPRKTGERPGQRIGGDQPQPNGIQGIDKGSKTIQQGVQDINQGSKTIQQGIALGDHGAALVQQGQTNLARGRALLRQGQVEEGNALVRRGGQEITRGHAEIKKGTELIKQGEKEVRAGQVKLEEGHKQIKDAEKTLRDVDKRDQRAAQAIKQADQYQQAARQVDTAGDQYVKAGKDALVEADKWLPGGQNSTEPAPQQNGPAETEGRQTVDQQGVGATGQQQGAGVPGQQQGGAQDATAALAGIALAAGAFAQAAGQGVQAIIEAGIAAASQLDSPVAPLPGAPLDESHPVSPEDARKTADSDESKAPQQHDDNRASVSPRLPYPESVPDRRTNLFPQSDDPPEKLPPAPVIEPLVLPSQDHPAPAMLHADRPTVTGPDGVAEAEASFAYTARRLDEPVGDVPGAHQPVIDQR
ncbi:hypothetical protein AB0B25_17410 [Nocardia sp. NPDC049190]|uniref:hypothetical protein n=1 Tax=Nocardia sp. NPDC049190 TaxID=3155650 RepID=UPI00340E9B11